MIKFYDVLMIFFIDADFKLRVIGYWPDCEKYWWATTGFCATKYEIHFETYSTCFSLWTQKKKNSEEKKFCDPKVT